MSDIENLDEEVNETTEVQDVPERDFSGRNVLVVEPDDDKAQKLEDVLLEIMPGVQLTVVSDCDEALEIAEDGEFDTCVIDLQYEEFSSHKFIKSINNDADCLLVAFNVDNVDPSDFQNRFKLEPMRKLFDNDKSVKIKV